MSKQSYQCDTKECHNRTYSTLPEASWLETEIAECGKCRRLIVFSTLYNPVLYRPNVPVWAKGSRTNAQKPHSFYSTEDSQEATGRTKNTNPPRSTESRLQRLLEGVS
jgi:hypothetical protein